MYLEWLDVAEGVRMGAWKAYAWDRKKRPSTVRGRER